MSQPYTTCPKERQRRAVSAERYLVKLSYDSPAVHGALPPFQGMIVCADDTCLCVSHSYLPPELPFACCRRASSSGIICFCIEDAVLTCSKRPLHHGYPKLPLVGVTIAKVRKHGYLCVTLYSGLFWRPHVTAVLIRRKRLISFIHRIRGIRSGFSVHSLPSLHLALVLSGILYAATLVSLTQSLWRELERIHCAGLRVALGYQSYSRIEAT